MSKAVIRTAALVAASSIALVSGTAYAQAQSAPGSTTPESQESQTDEVTVIGTRSSLEDAERFKRDSDVLVDGISADDIGALPDESIADSLVRIPGLTANDTEDGFGEVSIRGLGPDLANTTYNGRILPSTRFENRRLDLGDLPTEGVARAFVQKTAAASTIEGGLGGTIGLESVRPLETRRRGLSLVLRGITTDVSQALDGANNYSAYGYRGEVSYAGRLADNLGLSFAYAHIEQTNANPSVQLNSYTSRRLTGDRDGDGLAELVPQNAGIIMGASEFKRDSALAMVQWRPVDSLMVSLDGYYITSAGTGRPIRFFADGLSTVAREPTTYEVTDSVVRRYNGFGTLLRGIVNDNSTGAKQIQGGLNLRWDNGGPFSANFDAVWAQAELSGTNRNATFVSDATNTAQNAAGQIRPVAFDATDPQNITVDFFNQPADDFALTDLNIFEEDMTDTIKSARLDFRYNRPFAIFDSMDFGLRYENRVKDRTPNGDTYTFGTVLANRPDLDASYLVEGTNPLGELADWLGGPGGVAFPLFDIDKLIAFQDDRRAIFNSQPVNDVINVSTITEDTMSLYYQANLNIADRLTGNIGVRYFTTDQVVEGFATSNAAPGAPAAPVTPLRIDADYDYVLPSLNLRYEITRPLILRAALSKTLSRAPFNALRIGSAVDYTSLVEDAIISRGNPDLQPFASRNADLGIEWYPGRAMSFGLQGYYREVTNFIRNEAVETTLTLPSGAVIPVTINTPTNDPAKRQFYGFEVLVRRDFNFLPGFLRYLGVRADYSHNFTDARDLFAGGDGQQSELTPNNFTPSIANVQLYYSRRFMDIRLAYRYYEPYSRQITNGYQSRPDGTLDLSGNFVAYRGIRVLGIIRNLTKSRIYSNFKDYRFPDNFGMARNATYPGRSFTIGIRANF